MNSHKVASWQSVAALFVIYIVALIFYRLVLHPLAHVPGPKLAAFTRWYEAYFDIVHNGQYTIKIAAMHKKYGPIIRISPHELHVNDYNYFEKLYRQDGRWDKHAWTYDGFLAKGATLSTGPHELHKARRLPLNRFFSKARVAAHQHIIDRSVEKLCHRISQFTGNTVNLGAALSAITRDISCEFVLNKTHVALDEDDFSCSITNMFQKGGGIWRITKHIPWFGPLMQAIPQWLTLMLVDKSTRAFFHFIEECENDTRKLFRIATASSINEDAPRTIVHEIIDSNLPPEEKTITRMLDEVKTITGAGFETTASVMRLISYHVFSNPLILQRLRAEIMNEVSPSGDARFELKALERLPYLTSVIMEGVRLSPGIASRMARIAPDRYTFYGNFRIPPGTPVGMTTILMHTSEELYEAPFSFDPDRWMDPEARKSLDKVYAPFSKGTRSCLGMHLAWAEMYLITAALVKCFDFEFRGVEGRDFEMHSDQFIIGVKAGADLAARVTVLNN